MGGVGKHSVRQESACARLFSLGYSLSGKALPPLIAVAIRLRLAPPTKTRQASVSSTR